MVISLWSVLFNFYNINLRHMPVNLSEYDVKKKMFIMLELLHTYTIRA
jgi:hypothetical protein